MKKFLGKKAARILIIGILLVFTSCSSGLAPQEYIEYEMDASYKNIYNNALLNIYTSSITSQELSATYNENMKSDALTFLSTTCGVDTNLLTEQTAQMGADIFKALYEHAKYEIGDSESSGENFTVSMTIYPINIIINTVTQEFYDAKVQEIYTQYGLTEQELENEFASAMLLALEENLPTLSYASPVNIDVLLENKGDYFEISTQSWQDINNNILLF